MARSWPLWITRWLITREEIASFFHKINPLWTSHVQSRWLDIGIVLFYACLWTSAATALTLCFIGATLCADWLDSITYCIFWDLFDSDKLSYIF